MPSPLRMAAALVLLLASAPACRLYPPVVEEGAAVPAPAPGSPAEDAAPPARGPRIQLFTADDPAYAALAGTGDERTIPDAPERLLVLHDGEPVLDLGLRLAKAEEQGRVPLEEQVSVADDASAAVIVRIDRSARSEQSALTWLPATDPQQSWKKSLDAGHRVLLALPLPAERGLVLVTGVPDAPDQLRVYGNRGVETFHLSGAPASVIELRASPTGRYVGADLAFTSRPGAPDRAVWIHDVVARTAWTHSWSYGSDQEVTAWRLLEDGTLQADTAGFTLEIGPGDRVFDRKRRRP